MCPDTEQLRLKQSLRKKCDIFPACNGEPLVYHCVRNRERLAEVCAPRHVITGISYRSIFQGVMSILKFVVQYKTGVRFRFILMLSFLKSTLSKYIQI